MAKHDFPREMDEGYEKAVQKLRAVIEEKIDEWQGETQTEKVASFLILPSARSTEIWVKSPR